MLPAPRLSPETPLLLRALVSAGSIGAGVTFWVATGSSGIVSVVSMMTVRRPAMLVSTATLMMSRGLPTLQRNPVWFGNTGFSIMALT